MLVINKLLLALYVLPFLKSETKVGLLVSKNDRYKDALKKLSNQAVQNLQNPFTLVTEEYDGEKLQGMVEACCKLISDGVSVVVTKAASSDTAIQSDIFSPLKIPHIAVSATDPYLWNQNREYLLRLSASDDYQSKAIYDLIKHYKWREIIVLATSDSYGLNGMVKLQNKIFSDPSVKITDFIFPDADKCTAKDISQRLKTIQKSLVKIIVLNVEQEFGKCVLEEANNMGLMGSDYVWIVTDAIATQPDYLASNDGTFLSFYEGLIGIRPSLNNKGDKFTKVKDSYLSNGGKADDLTTYTILTYDAMGLIKAALTSATKAIDKQNIKCSSESEGWDQGKTVLDWIVNTTFSGISGEIDITKEERLRRNPSYDILNFIGNRFTEIGKWTNSSGLNITTNPQFFNGVKDVPPGVAINLTGTHLRLGTIEDKPFMIYQTEGCKGNKCWTGMVNEIVESLAKNLSFTYEYVQPSNTTFGKFSETTGEWSGLVGDLLANKSDMIAIDMSTNSQRKIFIDFSFPFMSTALRAVIKGESHTSNEYFFLKPFSGLVWGMIFVVNFALVVLICCLGKFSPFGKYGAKLHAVKTCPCDECQTRREDMITNHCSLRNTNKYDCLVEKVEDEDRSTDASLYNSLWLISTGLVSQAGETLPHCFSGRFLLIIWWAFMLIANSLYTANLTAALTKKNIGIPLHSVLDLLGQSKYKWGLIGDGRNPEALLKLQVDPRYAQVVKKGETLKNMEEGMKKVNDRNFVFIDESPALTYYQKGDCDIVNVGQEFQSFELAFGLPKGSPYKPLIDFHLLRLRENGEIANLWKKWSNETNWPNCTKKGAGTQVKLELKALSGLFILLCAGVGLSFIALLVEFVYAIIRDTKEIKGLTMMKALRCRAKFIFADLSNRTKVSQKTEEDCKEDMEHISKKI